MFPTRQLFVYSVLRIGVFVAVFVSLMLLGIFRFAGAVPEALISALVAAVVSMCIAYLFFRNQRDDLARSFHAWRHGEHRDPDSDLENEVLDRDETVPAEPRKRL